MSNMCILMWILLVIGVIQFGLNMFLYSYYKKNKEKIDKAYTIPVLYKENNSVSFFSIANKEKADIFVKNLKKMRRNIKYKLIPPGNVTDGSKSFNRLYAENLILFKKYANLVPNKAFKTRDAARDGFFIVGIETPIGYYIQEFNSLFYDEFDVVEYATNPAKDDVRSGTITRMRKI